MGDNYKEMGSKFISNTISCTLTQVSGINDFSKKTSNLDSHVHALEEEMRKIEGFKRELPNCMHLLRDAIERLKEERQRLTGRVMEEIPLFWKDVKGDGKEKESNGLTEKKNWMSSVQLWSTPVRYGNNINARNQDSIYHLTSGYEERGVNERELQVRDFRNTTGAFVAFKKPSMKEKEGTAAIAEGKLESRVKGDCGISRLGLQQPHIVEQQRKQRRCWSPELHRRFVDALNQLGGPQTATPKQIREVMKVDGLTNDEVKSHLQKYRIHIKKVSDCSSSDMVAHSGSSEGPLHGARAAKEEEEDSESHD